MPHECLCIYIHGLYGANIYKQICDTEKLWKKQTRVLCTLTFLKQCHDAKFEPMCARVKFAAVTVGTEWILHQAYLAVEREHIRCTWRMLNEVSQLPLKAHLEVANAL